MGSPPVTALDSSSRSTQAAAIRVLWVTLFLNLTVSVGKILVGCYAGLLNVLADGLHSLSDAFINVIGLATLKLAGRPPDQRHPYGYEKYETLGAMIVGSIAFVLFLEVFVSGVRKLAYPEPSLVGPAAYAVMVVSILFNIVTVVYEGRMGRRLQSEFLIADSRETASDIWVSAGILVALILIGRGWGWVDGVVTLLISLIVLKNSLAIFRSATRILSDEAVLNAEEVIAAVTKHPKVRWCHAVRSRGKPDAVYVELHLGVDPQLSVEESHDVISHEVKELLATVFPGVKCVSTHIEPDHESARNRKHSVFRHMDY